MNRLIVSPSPHMVSNNSTTSIMRDVLIALIPAFIVSMTVFGPSALVVTAVSVIACVFFEWLCRKVMKRPNTISDLSAAVTGVLLAFNLPPSIPLWMVILGAFFAIVVVKQLFGGIGQNFANPAIAARIMLFISFGTQMTTWTKPFAYLHSSVDAVTQATPLVEINAANTWNLFVGNIPGCIGEISALALLIGGIYMTVRKVINPVVPIVFIGTVFIITWIGGENPLNNILAGGLFLGSIFMITDYSTTPSTFWGKILFAFGCGVITSLIRLFGSYPEGVSFAILLMNLLTPLIDRAIKVRPFGVRRAKNHV